MLNGKSKNKAVYLLVSKKILIFTAEKRILLETAPSGCGKAMASGA
jgi:hypothetical protein